MSFVHVFFSLIFIKLWCVCSFWQNSGCFSRITWFKTVSRSVDQLKQALGSYMSLWLCFLFWLTSSLSLDEHVLASRSCLSVYLCTWLAAWCDHQRGAAEDSALVDRSQLFLFGTKNWLEELTRSTSTHLFILSFLTLVFTLHHTLQKERKPMPANDSFFLSLC